MNRRRKQNSCAQALYLLALRTKYCTVRYSHLHEDSNAGPERAPQQQKSTDHKNSPISARDYRCPPTRPHAGCGKGWPRCSKEAAADGPSTTVVSKPQPPGAAMADCQTNLMGHPSASDFSPISDPFFLSLLNWCVTNSLFL